MSNVTDLIMMNMSNQSHSNIVDCGVLTYSIADKVNGTIKVLVFVMLFLLFFEMWAIKRVINSSETHDKKRNLIDMIMTFIHPLLILFVFYIIYFIFLSGIDF